MTAADQTSNNQENEKKVSNKKIMLRAGGLGCGLFVLAFVILAVAFMVRTENFVRYGLTNGIKELQIKLELERTLTDEQFNEMDTYLRSMRTFIVGNKMTKENMAKYHNVSKVFRDSFEDGRITRTELGEIRKTMLTSQIPIITDNKNKKKQVPKPTN